LLSYLDAPARIAEHGGNARQHAEQRFSIPAMAEAYARVYDQTLARRR
jgi:glycosyltransferase involved in cell wall biosynthesis